MKKYLESIMIIYLTGANNKVEKSDLNVFPSSIDSDESWISATKIDRTDIFDIRDIYDMTWNTELIDRILIRSPDISDYCPWYVDLPEAENITTVISTFALCCVSENKYLFQVF